MANARKSQKTLLSMLQWEQKSQQEGFSFVIGIDEAGRGPLAGPVVAAAVCLKETDFSERIDDSKKLSAQQRERAFHEIQAKAHVGVGIMSEAVIDDCNILQATFHAMHQAVDDLFKRIPDCRNEQCVLLIDGHIFRTSLPVRYHTIIDGDALSLSIACASIMAKVTRDRILDTYDKVFPQYGFKKHKGYGTAVHRQAIAQHGPSIIHRKTFLQEYVE
jgi:ribonuclease HII